MYIHLEFENAKLFFGKYGKINGSDRVNFSNDVTSKRIGSTFVEPITSYQISNVIRVLFGERPISTLRGELYGDINDNYYEMANNSYLRLDNNKHKIKSGDLRYINETTSTIKCKHNSHNGDVKSSWEIIRRYFSNDDNLNEFIRILDNILGYECRNKPTVEICEDIKRYKDSDGFTLLTNWLRTIKKLSVKDFLLGLPTINSVGVTRETTDILSSTKLTHINGIDKIIKFSGELFVPITIEQYKILKEVSIGCTTILDGGLVNIVGVEDDFESYGYIKVSEISLEKSKYEDKDKI